MMAKQPTGDSGGSPSDNEFNTTPASSAGGSVAAVHSRLPTNLDEKAKSSGAIAQVASSKAPFADDDERWQIPQKNWGALVMGRCDDLGLTLADLADQIGESKKAGSKKAGIESLKNWVNCRSRVRWEWLSAIGRVLQIPMTVQLAELQLIDDESLLHLASMLERERAESQSLLRQIAALSRVSQPSARLAQAALNANSHQHARGSEGGGETFDVSFRPWMEGLEPYRVRAGDYMALATTNGDPISLERVEGLLGAELSSEGCVRIKLHKNWPVEWTNDIDLTESDTSVNRLCWCVPGLNAIKAPALAPLPLPFSSIMIFGTHTSSWGTDVASLVAAALGWGSAATTTLTRMNYGSGITEPENERWKILARQRMAAEALREPNGRTSQMVFAHTQAGAMGPVVEHIKKGRQDPLVVFLRPTSRLLDYICIPRKRSYVPRDELEEVSHLVEEALVNSTTPHLIIDVGFPDDIDPHAPLTPGLRDRKLSRSMIVAALIINYLSEGLSEEFPIPASCPKGFADFLRACTSPSGGVLTVPEFNPPVNFL